VERLQAGDETTHVQFHCAPSDQAAKLSVQATHPIPPTNPEEEYMAKSSKISPENKATSKEYINTQ
jgi:hypothetical protein